MFTLIGLIVVVISTPIYLFKSDYKILKKQTKLIEYTVYSEGKPLKEKLKCIIEEVDGFHQLSCDWKTHKDLTKQKK